MRLAGPDAQDVRPLGARKGAGMATTLSRNLRADRVSGLRLRQICSVESSSSIEEVVQCMIEQRTGCALVMRGGERGELIGIFTERDFVARVVSAGLDVNRPVESVMTPSPKTIRSDASVYDAIEVMQEGGYRHLPVLGEDGNPLGVLSVKDIMHYLVEYFPANVYNLPPTPVNAQPAREGA